MTAAPTPIRATRQPRYTHPAAQPDQLVVPHPTDLPLAVVSALHRSTGVDLLDDTADGAGLYAALAYYVRHLDEPDLTYDQVANTLRRRDIYVLAPSINDTVGDGQPDPTAPAPSPGSPPPGQG